MAIAVAVVRINDIKHYYCCGYLLQCIFVMFASLLNGLLQTLIKLVCLYGCILYPILNFIHSRDGTVLILFNGLIDVMIEYIFGSIISIIAYLFGYVVGSEIVVFARDKMVVLIDVLK